MLDALVAEARLRWGLDPGLGLQVVATEHLVATPLEPSRPALLVPAAILRTSGGDGAAPVEPLAGRGGPGGDTVLGVLRRLYPADHPVGRARSPEGTTIGGLVAGDLAGPLYLAPVDPQAAVASPWAMPWISDRLRRPDGCPWDREQTHQSLRKHLLEEAYEVYDALEAGATPALADELGDLLLQVVLHAQLAAEAGVFDLTDVQAAIARKIVRRHPHVFGDAVARTARDVNRQWERIKADERASAEVQAAAAGGAGAAGGDAVGMAGADEATAGDVGRGGDDPTVEVRDGDGPAVGASSGAAPRRGALDGISRSMPALAASQEMQERASALGYDWPTIDGIVDKVREELAELLAADTPDGIREELGDLMMVIVNLARRHDVEAEAALRAANDKFRRRFGSVERAAAERGVALRDMTFEQLDELWDAAKAEERLGAVADRPAGDGPAGPEGGR